MNQTAYRYDNDLKPFMVRFFIAATLLLAMAVACVSQLRSRLVLEQTLEGLTRAQSGLARVKEANANRKHALAALQPQFGQGAQNNSPEMVLYGKIDEIKARLNPDDMTITSVEKKGEEASLQYTLTFINPDFNNLLNAASYLYASDFPLTPVSSVTITRSEVSEIAGVSAKIAGKVISIRKTNP